MKKIIPYSKDIVFKTNIATINSISLEHEEKILENDVEGEFILFGDYKIHNDTTEKEDFKYHLPFTIDFTDNINRESIEIDIEDFTYEIIENDVLRINIKFSLNAEELPEISSEEDLRQPSEDFSPPQLKENIRKEDNLPLPEDIPQIKEEQIISPIIDEKTSSTNPDEPEMLESRTDNLIEEAQEDGYVTYHIHIIKEQETIEDVLKKYECTIDDLRMYNNITEIKIGDKIIIPDYQNV